MYVKNNDITYFDNFGVEHIPKEIKAFINRPSSSAFKNRNIKTNIFGIKAYDSIMYGYFCIGFINFMFKSKSLTEYTNLFLPNDFKKNDDMESYCLKCKKYTKNINSQVSSTSNGKMMILSKCANVVVKNLNLLITKKQKDY